MGPSRSKITPTACGRTARHYSMSEVTLAKAMCTLPAEDLQPKFCLHELPVSNLRLLVAKIMQRGSWSKARLPGRSPGCLLVVFHLSSLEMSEGL